MDCSIAGEENPVTPTKIKNPLIKIGGFLILYYSFQKQPPESVDSEAALFTVARNCGGVSGFNSA